MCCVLGISIKREVGMNSNSVDTMEPITGGCACGAVRYRTMAPPEFSLLCQCRQCQRISGAGHAAQFAAHADKTTVDGSLQYFELLADSGNRVRSGFCGACGSPVLKTTSGFPHFLFIHAATLDAPANFKPQMLVWSHSAQPWDQVDPSLLRR